MGSPILGWADHSSNVLSNTAIYLLSLERGSYMTPGRPWLKASMLNGSSDDKLRVVRHELGKKRPWLISGCSLGVVHSATNFTWWILKRTRLLCRCNCKKCSFLTCALGRGVSQQQRKHLQVSTSFDRPMQNDCDCLLQTIR